MKHHPRLRLAATLATGALLAGCDSSVFPVAPASRPLPPAGLSAAGDTSVTGPDGQPLSGPACLAGIGSPGDFARLGASRLLASSDPVASLYDQLTVSNTGASMFEVGVPSGLGANASGTIFTRGINDDGYILADFELGAGGLLNQPYLWREGNGWTAVPVVPGASQNFSRALNNSRVVVGSATTGAGTFAWRWAPSGTVESLGAPAGATETQAFAINNGGEVAGFVRVAGLRRAATWSNGVWTVLGAPVANTEAIPQGNNNLGWVVGYHFPNFSSARAFVWRPGTGFQNLDRPAGAQTARAIDVNDKGQVVGWSNMTDGSTQGWIWENGSYTLFPAFPGTNTTFGLGISNGGIVAGYGITAADGAHAFARLPSGEILDLGKHTDACSSISVSINEVLQIAGLNVFTDPARRRVARWDLGASLGDRVWNDEDADGVQDAGEPGFVGVQLTLYDAGGSAVATTVTGADGVYAFRNLLAGTYKVCVTGGLPAGFTQTYDLDGVPTANCATASLVDRQNRTDLDFGYTKPAPRFTLGDRVWDDLNGNAAQDAGEPGLVNVTVTIRDAGNAVVGTTQTAANGIYSFGDLLAGSYTVCVTAGVPGGYAQTFDLDGLGTPNCATATVGPDRVDVDFGYVKPSGVIGNYTWIDANGNGRQDAGEPVLAGVKLALTGSATGTQLSNAGGNYLFTGLGIGTFHVTATAPAGFQPTTANAAGVDAALNSNASPSTVTFAVANGSDLTIDFGFVPNAGAGQGCTPGYWKQRQHTDSWRWYKPADLVDAVFGVNRAPTLTLLGAIDAPGNDNASQLFRHGAAALLNSVYQSGVSYPFTAPQVIAMVRTAWLSGSDAQWEATKNRLAAANEAGCPLN